MARLNPERRFFEAWLHRTRRQLAQSGRLSQIAHLLAQEDGNSEADWRFRLREMLEGGEPPNLDLLTRIEKNLSVVKEEPPTDTAQQELF